MPRKLQKFEDYSMSFSKKAHWTRDEFLEIVMPDSKPENRLKKLREYFRARYSGLYEGNELEQAVIAEVEAFRKIGTSSESAPMEAMELTEFVTHLKRYLYTERGKKGATARKAKADTKRSLGDKKEG
jgi:hypothetical protein